MRMNEVIREKRKELGLTQEQIAVYLGVTAPAVHKWEKGTSLPDVTILPALARILKTDLNTLFTFEEELTDQEINAFCNDVILKMQAENYDAGFELAMEKVREYPSCEKLIFSLAFILDGGLIICCVTEKEKYAETLETLYERASNAEDEEVRYSAVSVLINKALQKKDFMKAEKLWETLPDIMLDKRNVKATIYREQEKYDEAIRILEQKLYGTAGELQNCLINLMLCFEKAKRPEEMKVCSETLKSIIDSLGLWKYGKYMADFQVAVSKKDKDRTLQAVRLMLDSMEEKYSLGDFPLYRELIIRDDGSSNMKIFTDALLSSLKGENGVDGDGFLKDDEELQKILEEFTQRTNRAV